MNDRATDLRYGIVQNVIMDGKHGPYAVAVVENEKGKGEYVTFSLNPNVWKSGSFPERGNLVALGVLNLKIKGWRASYARFGAMSDEIPVGILLSIRKKHVKRSNHMGLGYNDQDPR